MPHGIDVVTMDYHIKFSQESLNKVINNCVKAADYKSALSLALAGGLNEEEAQQMVTQQASVAAQEKHNEIDKLATERIQEEMERQSQENSEAIYEQEYVEEPQPENVVLEKPLEN